MILSASLIHCPSMEMWFYGPKSLVLSCKDCLSSWFFRIFGGFESGLLILVLEKVVFSLLMCVLALGGAVVGAITGAIKGQTTETGLLRGLGVGAVAGAITAVQLLESTVNGEHFSKVALILSLVNGKIFMEWVGPAVLKAYQWQISSMDMNMGENSDIFEVNGAKGLSHDIIRKLPESDYRSLITDRDDPPLHFCCSICLHDLEKGDFLRSLPKCKHYFHIQCIDEWLSRHGNCPICRTDV